MRVIKNKPSFCWGNLDPSKLVTLERKRKAILAETFDMLMHIF